uniref:DUF5641 domain-containing protein n=1 Tax=Anopheles christyi TaxID=43041 RepID=A0A182KB45_9DIPT
MYSDNGTNFVGAERETKKLVEEIETLRAALIQIEAIINSRTLTHIPLSNVKDEILTPLHILIGRGVDSQPPVSLESSYVFRQQYTLAQHNAKVFWDRWEKENLPTLIKQNKWTNKVVPMKTSDVVVITNDNALQDSGRNSTGAHH